MNKLTFFILIFSLLIFASCETVQEKDEEVADKTTATEEQDNGKTTKNPDKTTKPKEEIVATFGNVTITKQDYIDTKSEISEVVDNLNEITKNNDYDRWLQYLSDDYIEYYSNKSVLAKVSKSLPVKNIHLNSLQDYFKFVFVPSRKNIRVDDIKFLSPSAVNVIMRNKKGSLLVYILEKQAGRWKLVPKK
ncbi:MAG: hypothetical protein CR988_05405 [Treponema sp.]|nr:MAG: hypothetical protein CR988_05405 [Treponema sp.]